MTGAVQSGGVVAATASLSYRITPGNNNSVAGVWGFNFAGSNPGSLSPITTFKGKSIELFRSDSAQYDLLIQLASPDIAQSFWRSVVVQDTSGVWRRYLSASATSFTGRSWTFGNGSSPVWTSATPRGVIFSL